MSRMKKAAIAAAALPSVAVLPFIGQTTSAEAVTATMGGVLSTAPKWNTITYQGAKLCPPCTEIEYPFSGWLGQMPIASGVAALDTWVAQTSGDKVVLAYSKGTHSALGWVRENANDPVEETVRFVLFGAPETPGNAFPSQGYDNANGLPATGDFTNVTYIVRQYDKAADYPADWWNLLAVANASQTTHLQGYDKLNLSNPDAVWVDPKTGATTLYFRTDVLPILAGVDWLLPDSVMAQLDSILRPIIESAYHRPVAIPTAAEAAKAKLVETFAKTSAEPTDVDEGTGAGEGEGEGEGQAQFDDASGDALVTSFVAHESLDTEGDGGAEDGDTHEAGGATGGDEDGTELDGDKDDAELGGDEDGTQLSGDEDDTEDGTEVDDDADDGANAESGDEDGGDKETGDSGEKDGGDKDDTGNKDNGANDGGDKDKPSE